MAPELRGLLGALNRKVLHVLDTPAVLEFVGASRCEELARRGTTCPDHFLRTRVRPLFVPFAPGRESAADLLARLPGLVEGYRRGLHRVLRALPARRLAGHAGPVSR